MKTSQTPSTAVFTAASPRRLLERRLNRFGRIVAVIAAVSVPLGQAAWAANMPDYFTGTTTGDLGTATNWSVGINPTISYDAVFSPYTAAGIRTLSLGNITVGSLDVLATTGVFGIQDSTTGALNTTITLGGSGNLGNSVTIGQANDLLYVASGATLNLYGKNGSTGTGVLGITLGQQHGNFDIAGTADIGSVISDGGNGYGIALNGAGTVALSAANTYTGATTIGAGTLKLNFADTTYTSTAPTNNIISSSSALVVNGNSTLNLTGNSAASNAQSFNGTTLNGFGSVTLTGGAAADGVLLNLGAITRNAGGGINIAAPTVDTTVGATNGATTTTANNAAGILGGWATYNSTDFATNNGTNIVAYSGYTALTAAGGGTPSTTIFNGGSLALTAPVTADGMKITTAGTITLGANNFTVNGANGGILATAVATIDTTGGGTLSAGSGNELILGGNSTLTIAGTNLIGANSGSLTKIGANTVVISGANSYTGGTFIDAGTVTVDNNTSLGTGPIVFGGGTLNVGAVATVANPIIVTADTSSTATPSGFALTLTGALTGSGDLLLNTGGGNYTGGMTGDFSQFTGTLVINTTNNGSNQNLGTNSSASQDNLGQGTLQLVGGVASNRRLGLQGNFQIGALESAPGQGTFIGSTLEVGALGANTYFGGGGTNGNTTVITKVGTGSLTLNDNAVMVGTINLAANNGALVIDETNITTPTGLFTGSLNVGGGTLTLLEKAGTATSQALTSTTINAGNSAITASQNGGSAGVLLQLGAITRNAGGAVNFVNPSGTLGATNGITTTTANSAGGILGGYATVGGTAYAVSGASATVPVSALSTYTQTWSTGSVADTTTTDNDTESGSVSLSGASTINSLTINDPANDTLTLGANNLTFSGAAGGLLYAGNGSGGGSYTIGSVGDSGILGAGAANEFIVNVNSGATLTVNNPIIGSGAGFLTTAGGGTLVLTATSSYTGANFLNGGTLIISADADLGTNSGAAALALNAATLKLAGGYASTLFSNNAGIKLGNNGGTINTNGNSVTYGGVITGGVVNSSSANTAGGFSFTKAGSGTLTLTGTNTYGGATIINGGVLSINSLANETANGGVTSSIGESPNTAPYLVLNGGTLQYTGTAASTDRQFTLGVNGGGIDSSGSGPIAWNGNTGSAGTAVNAVAISGAGSRTFTLTGNNTGANTFGLILGDSSAGATSLVKSGAGTWSITNANTYTGTTTISGGTLRIPKSAYLYNNNPANWTAANITVGNGATLALNVDSAGTNGFTAGNLTTLLTNLDGALTTGGLQAGSTLALDTSTATGGTLTLTTPVQNTTGTGGGAVSLTKLGAGMLTINASNTYTGATTVSGGTLALGTTTPLANTAITVASGATLQLTPSLGAVAIGSSGGASLTLGGGSSLLLGGTTPASAETTTFNTVTLNGNLSIGGPSSTTGLTFNLNGSTSDELAVMGTVTIGTDGGLITIVEPSSTTAPAGGTQTYTLVSASGGGLTPGGLTLASGSQLIDLGGNAYTASLGETGGTTETLTLNEITLTYYWVGGTSSSWSVPGNFATNHTGAALQTTQLASDNNVILTADSPSGTNTASQTLDNSYTVNSLTYSATAPAINLSTGSGGNGAANTLTLDPALGFNVTVGSSSPVTTNYGAGIGLVMQNGSAAQTLNVPVALGASQTWEIDSPTQALTVLGAISDGGAGYSLTKTGVGTLILSGADTYSGGTFVNAGSVALGSANALLTTGTATVEGTGTFDLAGHNQTLSTLSDGGVSTGTVTSSSGAPSLTLSSGTFSGTISGSLALTEAGPGTLTLSGANTYGGGTTITGGTLQIGVSNVGTTSGALGASTAAVTLGNSFGSSNASLLTSGAVTFSNNVTVAAGSSGNLSIGGASANASTFSGAITLDNNLAVSQVLGGTTNLTGNITSGAAGTQTLTFNNAGLVSQSTGVIGGGAGTIAVTQSGAGTTTLSGVETYTGNTSITAGTLAIGGSGDLGSGSYAGNISDAGSFIYESSVNQSLSGSITGAGALAMSGAGTLTLTGSNSNSGVTTVNSGTLQFMANAGNTAGNVAYSLSPGTTELVLGSNSTLALKGNTSGTIFAPAGSETSTTTGIQLSGAGPFNVSAGDTDNLTTGQTLALGGFGEFTDGAALNFAVNNDYTLQIGSGATGSGQLDTNVNQTINSTVAGGTLSIPGGFEPGSNHAYILTFGGAGFINVPGNLVNANSGSLGVYIAGPGTVTFSGANNYTRVTAANPGTTISGGTLVADSSTALSTIEATLGDPNTTTNNSSPTLLIGGAYSFSNPIIVSANATTGTYTIGGSTDNISSFTGGITASENFTISQVANTNGNSLYLTNSTTGVAIVGASAGTNTVNFNNAGNVNVTGIGDGTGGGHIAVTQSGAGTTTLPGPNTYTGATNVNAGTLIASGALSATASVSVAGGGTLQLGASNALNSAAPLTLSAGILQNLAGENQALGSLTLGTGSSTLIVDPSDAGAVLHLADSSANTWTGTLSITDWNGASVGGGTDQVFIGSSADLTSAQLADIQFVNGSLNGISFTTYGAVQLSDGELVAAAIPEPGTWAMMLSGAGMLVFIRRRRQH